MRDLKSVLFLMFVFISAWVVTANAKEADVKLLESFQNTVIDLAEKMKQSVVGVSPVPNRLRQKGSHDAPSDMMPHGQRGPNTPPGSGTGVIIDKKGLIVTNNHVVGDADEVEIHLPDKSKWIGKVIGKDPDTDLALVRIEAKKELSAAVIGDSDKVKVGQWVMAIGNPFGLDQTVTVGVISALGRENVNLARYENFLQTDASINPGNSGGPLFNIRGEVVGINTAIISFAQGIGFAIPSNMAQSVTQQLLTKGKVVRGWLGVGIQLITPELADQFGVKEGTGVLVNEVFEGEPANKAGVLSGDVILKVNDKEVDRPNMLARLIAGNQPGDKIKLDLLRNRETKRIFVELSERKGEAVTASLPKQQESFFGLYVQELTPEFLEQNKMKDEKGLIITKVDPGSPAEQEGVKEGDLLKEIKREKVDDMETFNKVTEKLPQNEEILLLIAREGRSFFVVLKSDEK